MGWGRRPKLHGMQGVRQIPQLHQAQRGPRWRITRLPMEHRAGQGAGDAVHDLDAEDNQPAQLFQTERLRLHLAMTS